LDVRLDLLLWKFEIIARQSHSKVQGDGQQKEPKKGCIFLIWSFFGHSTWLAPFEDYRFAGTESKALVCPGCGSAAIFSRIIEV
jgi:hypothetical protein